MKTDCANMACRLRSMGSGTSALASSSPSPDLPSSASSSLSLPATQGDTNVQSEQTRNTYEQVLVTLPYAMTYTGLASAALGGTMATYKGRPAMPFILSYTLNGCLCVFTVLGMKATIEDSSTVRSPWSDLGAGAVGGFLIGGLVGGPRGSLQFSAVFGIGSVLVYGLGALTDPTEEEKKMLEQELRTQVTHHISYKEEDKMFEQELQTQTEDEKKTFEQELRTQTEEEKKLYEEELRTQVANQDPNYQPFSWKAAFQSAQRKTPGEVDRNAEYARLRQYEQNRLDAQIARWKDRTHIRNEKAHLQEQLREEIRREAKELVAKQHASEQGKDA
eukprot:g21794.t1